jgi:hypothetical protein
MYIVAIAWLYVTLLVAAMEPTLLAGVMGFCFYGLLPVALLLWLGGFSSRRRRRLLADQGAHARDAENAKGDQ